MSSRLEPLTYREGKTTLRYLLALPAGYDRDNPGHRWPLVLFLHGSAERGRNLDKLLAYGPPRQISEGRAFPFLLVAPQCPPHVRWNVPVLGGLLDEIERTYAVDPERVVVTGVSMGGQGTWELGSATPGRFAALAPVCGWGDPSRACALRSVPVWAFHGAKDDTVPLAASQVMVEAVVACGGQAKLTIYPNAGHDSWTPTYNNPEVYEWLMAQQRAHATPS